jgi:hypothetical protein
VSSRLDLSYSGGGYGNALPVVQMARGKSASKSEESSFCASYCCIVNSDLNFSLAVNLMHRSRLRELLLQPTEAIAVSVDSSSRACRLKHPQAERTVKNL